MEGEGEAVKVAVSTSCHFRGTQQSQGEENGEALTAANGADIHTNGTNMSTHTDTQLLTLSYQPPYVQQLQLWHLSEYLHMEICYSLTRPSHIYVLWRVLIMINNYV